ncbi:hypothetical protein ACFYOK_07730 [Microbispora bryophytorum]|uniref:hypothetical protein n=1 Tax=Microbispora bryophytorum TaxID=1460882 RepID=UPI003410B09C
MRARPGHRVHEPATGDLAAGRPGAATLPDANTLFSVAQRLAGFRETALVLAATALLGTLGATILLESALSSLLTPGCIR